MRTILSDRNGGLWVHSTRSVVHLPSDGGAQPLTLAGGLLSGTVKSLFVDRGGGIWIGTESGITRLSDQMSVKDTIDRGLLGGIASSILEDAEGSVWVGTTDGGLHQFADVKFRTYGAPEGLPSDDTSVILEDLHGGLWIGTNGGGLNRYADGKFQSYGKGAGLRSDNIVCLAGSADGGLWVGTPAGLHKFNDGKATAVKIEGARDTAYVGAVCAASDGSLWVSVFGRGLFHLSDGRWTVYTVQDGIPSSHVVALFEDHQRNLWIGTPDAGIACLREGKLMTYGMKDGLTSNAAYAFFEDAENGLWIATEGGGLNRHRNGQFRACTMKDGLFDDTIFCVVDDGCGYLWMTCNRGIFRVSLDDLRGHLNGSRQKVTSISYDKADGLRTAECSGMSLPSGIRTRPGELWFPTLRGAVRIDPRAIPTNRRPPPVAIEEAVLDGEPIGRPAAIDVPPGRGRLELAYACLSFVAPERVFSRYMLEGFDSDWIEAGTRREAHYTNIPPGRYVFHVIACNQDAVWNTTGTRIPIRVRPRIHQTYWFKALAGFILVGLVLVGHRLRLRQMIRREKEMQARIQQALAKIKILNGLLPICAWCRKVRDDKGYWNQLETYIREHSEATFSHGICPDCLQKYFPGVTPSKGLSEGDRQKPPSKDDS
ncbi:MAG: two-component regulator propeller domain-containing protein [Acidobacteriota bacterium]